MRTTPGRRPGRRAAILAALALAAAATGVVGAATGANAVPQPAHVYFDNGNLRFEAGDGTPNYVLMREITGGIEFEDSGGTILLGSGGSACTVSADQHIVRCVGTITSIYVTLADGNDRFHNFWTHRDVTVRGGDGDDRIHNNGPFPVRNHYYGDRGKDTLTGSAGDDYLHGGPGDDDLRGYTGNDTLFGETGNDILTGDEGNDTLQGYSGNDTFNGGADYDIADFSLSNSVNVTLDGRANDGHPGERSNVQLSIEHVKGSGRDDTLTGNDDRNILDGGFGNDTLHGKGGDDVLDAQKGAGQKVYCGDGDDIGVGYDLIVWDHCER